MAEEIERKFLVAADAWRQRSRRALRMRQGYLSGDERGSVRVRTAGERAWLNVKSATIGARRLEFEYEIPLEDGEIMLARLCRPGIIDKTRYWIEEGDRCWEVDVFHGDNEGLVVAEVELEDAASPLLLPDWVGLEVTDDPRYYNTCLAETPYRRWGTSGRNGPGENEPGGRGNR